jgi:hypothetical protein
MGDIWNHVSKFSVDELIADKASYATEIKAAFSSDGEFSFYSKGNRHDVTSHGFVHS